ncbi:ParB/RepB/Spo0J family partition protein [Mesorhizobium sp. BE184]|uniref:ParB/RepB/Spo0J family partition protein n=1 Tax=Mesorhizobium sp. BE184 TaxID=2817714 RepID=UPI00285F33B5|nr:ParB/RepB/Spo0J family partition protein [Mesorhizobium sp. BE184]MDR7035241.1 hypothetical protein [Mesorhizobium sp. BE184]
MIRLQPADDHGLALDVIQIDGGTQSRATLNQHVVDDYAEAIKTGATFPPIVVFYDGKKHWLADGFHRFHAYQKAGRTSVNADVRQGTRRDAILHSVGANEAHGLRRTNDDKRRAVLTLLNDAEWGAWSDSDVRKKCAVSLALVQKIRKEVTYGAVSERPAPAPPPPVPAAVQARFEKIEAAGGTPRFYKNKHGNVGVMNVAGINAGRTQSQAKASEDNGSITGGAGPVTGEASRLASGRTDAGEAASVDLPTVPVLGRRDPLDPVLWQVMQLREAWAKANAEARAIFLAEIKSSDGMASGSEHHSADHVSPPVRRRTSGSGSANAGGENVTDADTANTFHGPNEGKTSLAAREGEKPLHSNFPSASPRAEAVADPQASQAPKATAISFNPDPHNPQVDDGRPDPSSNVAGAKSDVPHVVGQGGVKPVVHFGEFEQQSAGNPQGRNEPASGASASVIKSKPFVLRPHCLKPDLCAGSGANHCHACKKAMAEGEAT